MAPRPCSADTALHCTALHCTVLHCAALALHCALLAPLPLHDIMLLPHPSDSPADSP